MSALPEPHVDYARLSFRQYAVAALLSLLWGRFVPALAASAVLWFAAIALVRWALG